MANYERPVRGLWRVTDDYTAHANRTPPSVEPGTDYGVNHGSPIYTPAVARVVDIKTTTAGAMGRYVMLHFGGNHWARALHLASVGVAVGDQIPQGHIIGRSGGSAWGSETGVGAHCHWTFWDQATQPRPGADRPVPWENYLGKPAPGFDANTHRKTNAHVNRRGAPSTRGAALPNGLAPGDVGNFTGFIRGERIDGNEIWFRGISGNFFWSGGFAGGAHTAGLKDLGRAS